MTVSHPLLTTTELAAKLRVPTDYVYNLVNKNELPHRRIGTVLRYDSAEIDRWLNSKTEVPATPVVHEKKYTQNVRKTASGRFEARVNVTGFENKHVGTFDSEEAAQKAVLDIKTKAKKHAQSKQYARPIDQRNCVNPDLPRGVSKLPKGNGYGARISVGGKQRWLGTFATSELAQQAYINAVSKAPQSKNIWKGPRTRTFTNASKKPSFMARFLGRFFTQQKAA